MLHATLEVSAYRCDEARCSRCGGLLTRTAFVTDFLGRTVERCPTCGPRLLVLHVGAPVASRIKHAPVPKMIQGCADCGGWMLWMGFEKPTRCKVCQKVRARKRDLARYRRLHA